jgi:uncharacterized protein YmfQ (DUF2313 family)
VKKHSSEDYQRMFLQLQPPGRAWSRRLDSDWGKLWRAGGDGLARLESEVLRLIREANPLFADASLVDWERVTGLPDECTMPGEGEDTRRAAVVAKLQRPGGQSVDFFLQFLGPFGDKIEISFDWPPFLASKSVAYDRTWELPTGYLFLDDSGVPKQDFYWGWRFVWKVVRVNHQGRRFRAGRGRAGDPLIVWRGDSSLVDANLECRVNQLKPAHTLVFFEYVLDNEG